MKRVTPTKEQVKIINKVKLTLTLKPNTTFFSSLLANLKIVWIDHEDMPTAATDGIHLYLSPNFIETLDTYEILGLLLHEVLHVAYEHMDRRKQHDADPMLWNVAGDYVINNFLDNSGFKLPKDGLIDHIYDNMTTKQIYDLLKENCITIQVPWNDLIDPGSEKGIKEHPGMSPQECRERVITNIMKAATQAKLSNDVGSIPGDIARSLEDLLNPKLPWQSILQNNLNSYASTDYTWKRPNRRLWPKYYLPNMQQESLGQITASIDVSGSITDQQLQEFISEIQYIKTTLRPKLLRLITFDTEIRFDRSYDEFDEIEEVSSYGGGGTQLGPLMNTLSKDQPDLVIILTDGYFKMPYMEDIEGDIFWIIHSAQENSFNPPKGIVIPYQ